MTLDFNKLKVSTKGLIAFLIGLGSLLQVPQVSAPVFALAKSHPHFASVIAVITAVATLLHNPQVEAFFGMKQTATKPDGTETTTEVVVK